MSHIFYFFSIFALTWEIYTILNTAKVHAFIIRFKNTDHTKKELSEKEATFSFFAMGYFVWLLVGIITFQWPIFLLLFLSSLMPKRFMIIRWIDSFVTSIALLYIILNAYHFKVDVWQVILNAIG